MSESVAAAEQYQNLMEIIRQRFDLILKLKEINADAFSKTETAAFHGRKIIEGIAFSCLVATKNGLNHIPRDVQGQWNAEKILADLKKKNINIFPSPSEIRQATLEEKTLHNINITIEGLPDYRLAHNELIEMYKRLHKWLHEINPYVEDNRHSFLQKNESQLWEDLGKIQLMMERHFMSIGGKGFYCTLWDKSDGATKIIALQK